MACAFWPPVLTLPHLTPNSACHPHPCLVVPCPPATCHPTMPALYPHPTLAHPTCPIAPFPTPSTCVVLFTLPYSALPLPYLCPHLCPCHPPPSPHCLPYPIVCVPCVCFVLHVPCMPCPLYLLLPPALTLPAFPCPLPARLLPLLRRATFCRRFFRCSLCRTKRAAGRQRNDALAGGSYHANADADLPRRSQRRVARLFFAFIHARLFAALVPGATQLARSALPPPAAPFNAPHTPRQPPCGRAAIWCDTPFWRAHGVWRRAVMAAFCWIATRHLVLLRCLLVLLQQRLLVDSLRYRLYRHIRFCYYQFLLAVALRFFPYLLL